MTCTLYNPGQYLVTSRTRAGIEHLADIVEMTCSCEAALDFATTGPTNPCAHLEAALAHHHGARSYRPPQGSAMTLLGLCRKK